MATQPLLDLDAIDLDQVIAGPAELLSKLAQRGTFEMLGGVNYRDEERGLIVGFKDIRTDDWWAPDHIPGRPLFPGALMIESAAQLCSYDYHLRMADSDRFVGFGGLNATRFRGVVEPPGRMYFVGKVNRIRTTLFTYHAQGFYGGDLVFEAEIIGVAL
ncbi:MAG: beta-hydroxyacyl-ACP dehydratase [Planctomycetes bacterium]|nr:beta-hydroxyacyl-ACP dehydratase [Planctomycetota bacterium]